MDRTTLLDKLYATRQKLVEIYQVIEQQEKLLAYSNQLKNEFQEKHKTIDEKGKVKYFDTVVGTLLFGIAFVQVIPGILTLNFATIIFNIGLGILFCYITTKPRESMISKGIYYSLILATFFNLSRFLSAILENSFDTIFFLVSLVLGYFVSRFVEKMFTLYVNKRNVGITEANNDLYMRIEALQLDVTGSEQLLTAKQGELRAITNGWYPTGDKYYTIEAIVFIIESVENHIANTMSEAARYYEDHLRHQAAEAIQKAQLRQLKIQSALQVGQLAVQTAGLFALNRNTEAVREAGQSQVSAMDRQTREIKELKDKLPRYWRK